MKGDCPQCGFPLNKGNVQVVRPRGKKRPYRIHRRCPELKALPTMPQEAVADLVKPEVFTGKPDHGETHSWKGDFHVDPPPRFRYFMTRDQAEKVKASVERNASFGFGIGFEVIPVIDYLVDQDPDEYADLVEVTIEWGPE